MGDATTNMGLAKLTEYLNQTRRQAETAIDTLNERINELTQENERALKLAEKFESERDYYRNYAEQLKLENSKKWRLQERDDWKAMVESAQRDRARLQNECHELSNALESATLHIKALEEELEQARLMGAATGSGGGGNTLDGEQSSPSHSQTNSEGNIGTPKHNLPRISTGDDATPSPTSNPNASPRAMNVALKRELEKAQALMDSQRRAAEQERISQQTEIMRLKQELANYKRLKGHETVDVQLSRTKLPKQNNEIVVRDSGGWLALGILSFLFPSPSSSKKALIGHGVLHV